jgi:hypothetical protein
MKEFFSGPPPHTSSRTTGNKRRGPGQGSQQRQQQQKQQRHQDDGGRSTNGIDSDPILAKDRWPKILIKKDSEELASVSVITFIDPRPTKVAELVYPPERSMVKNRVAAAAAILSGKVRVGDSGKRLTKSEGQFICDRLLNGLNWTQIETGLYRAYKAPRSRNLEVYLDRAVLLLDAFLERPPARPDDLQSTDDNINKRKLRTFDAVNDSPMLKRIHRDRISETVVVPPPIFECITVLDGPDDRPRCASSTADHPAKQVVSDQMGISILSFLTLALLSESFTNFVKQEVQSRCAILSAQLHDAQAKLEHKETDCRKLEVENEDLKRLLTRTGEEIANKLKK